MKFSFIFVVLVFASSCASTIPKSLDERSSREGSAIVYGQGGGASGFLKSILAPVGIQKDIRISSLNGGAIENKGEDSLREYWIKGGEHSLNVSCTIQVGGVLIKGREEIKATLLANKEYVLDAKVGKKKGGFGVIGEVDTCVPFLTEKISKEKT